MIFALADHTIRSTAITLLLITATVVGCCVADRRDTTWEVTSVSPSGVATLTSQEYPDHSVTAMSTDDQPLQVGDTDSGIVVVNRDEVIKCRQAWNDWRKTVELTIALAILWPFI